MARSVPVRKTIKTVSSFHHTGPGRARTNPFERFFQDRGQNKQPRRSYTANGGALVAARSSFPGLALVELDLAAWREVGGLRREKNGGRALFLAMTDPAAHPAFLAADLATAFTSATTGHAFSSGLSNRLRARRSHDVHGFS